MKPANIRLKDPYRQHVYCHNGLSCALSVIGRPRGHHYSTSRRASTCACAHYAGQSARGACAPRRVLYGTHAPAYITRQA
ncbi:jg22363 [Pararge aegeria aegeria]|uniref:Jg22363 protein n=1 Tax=Pararge aegeria aegeria TaxID=348720 RepID=A0A8S4S6R9_9NEOP|nr:jg22363 [Pararge aegeria aegeria]